MLAGSPTERHLSVTTHVGSFDFSLLTFDAFDIFKLFSELHGIVAFSSGHRKLSYGIVQFLGLLKKSKKHEDSRV